jgi:opacity protein-like surface antigen
VKYFALLTIVLILCCVSAFAQTTNKPEFFAGYSYESIEAGVTSSDLGTATSLDNRFSANGLNLSAADYFKKRFGVVGDFSAQYKNRPDFAGTLTAQSNFSLYNITGGPQFRFPNGSKITPFAHALLGVARRNLTENLSDGTTFIDHTTNFAMNFGGGVDYRLNNRYSVRLFQFDYNPIFLNSRTVNSITFPSRTLNGFRVSAGIVIK